MTETKRDEQFEDRVAQGLRELDGLESPPDVSERVAAGAATRVSGRRASGNALAAILVVALGLATAVGVWMNREPDSGPVPAAPQDPLPQLPPPVHIRSGKSVEAFPITTEHVLCTDFTPTDVRALRRFAKLRGVIFKGSEFDAKGLAELARLDKLESVSIQTQLAAEDVPHLRVLRSLPRLRLVGVTCDAIDDDVLRTLAAAKQISGVGLRGVLACSAKGMEEFAKGLPKLRHLSIEPIDRAAAIPLLDKAIWTALPASLSQLVLHRQRVPVESLRRLPGLKKLDLFQCPSVGRDLLQFTSIWPGCRIITPSGAHLVVDAKGRCQTQPRKVVLIQRTDNGPYRAAGYSFRYLSSAVADHRNEVDLLFDGCGNIHLSAFGGAENRLLDLGKEGQVPPLDELPATGWLTQSFAPVAGHRYLMHVRHKNEGKAFVQFDIAKAEGNRVWLEWRHVDAAQVFGMAEPPNRAHAGTKGQCGGRHGAR